LRWIGGATTNSLASDCYSGCFDSYCSGSRPRKLAAGRPVRFISSSSPPMAAPLGQSVRIRRRRAWRDPIDGAVLRRRLEPWADLLCWMATVHMLCCGRARSLCELLGQMRSGWLYGINPNQRYLCLNRQPQTRCNRQFPSVSHVLICRHDLVPTGGTIGT
jgi:hypothetical protein